MDRIRAFIRLSRLEFLMGGFLLFWLGTRAADADLTLSRYVAGQGMVTSIQFFAQYVNEHFDQATDAVSTNRTWFSGGSGIPASGRLPERAAIRAAGVAAVCAAAFGIWATTIDWRLGLIGLAGVAGSWLYSAPPARLIAKGSGEMLASLVVSGLLPLTGAISRGAVDWSLLGAFTIPLVLANMAMLLAFDAPDEAADEATGKRTLWIRLGPAGGVVAHSALSVAVLVAVLTLAPWRPAWSTVLGLGAIPLFAVQHHLLQNGRIGRRAYLLTVSAIASIGVLALGMGLGTMI